MASYILQEDGSSKITLEDGSGFLLLEPVSSPSSSVSSSPSTSVSFSVSSSVSTSPSSSISSSVSSSISTSPSPSTSISSSVSSSLSSSISNSPSISPSSSVSSSTSSSLSSSISSSPSQSISPSPSVGYQDYTRGHYAVLPTTDADLLTTYSEQDIIDVATSDDVRVGQTATSEYAVHQFKDSTSGSNQCTIQWEGQTNCPPSLSTVYLQIYNQVSGTWETVDSNNSAPANTDFTLSASMNDLTNYMTVGELISCRVYQLDI